MDTIVSFPEQENVSRFRIIGNDVLNGQVRMTNIDLVGSFEVPSQYFNEGRVGNNHASAILTYTCGAPVNSPPEIVSVPAPSVCLGDDFQYAIVADDPDVGQTLTYGLMAGPAGMTVDPDTGLVIWTPAQVEPSVSVSVVVSDGIGGVATQAFLVTVETCGNQPPVITSAAPATAAGNPWCHQAVATDADGDALSWALLASPTGMNIDSGTGLLCWSPAPSGTSFVSIQVADGAGGVATQSFTLAIGDAPSGPEDDPVDVDGDGYPTPIDCDDMNPDVHPGQIEIPGNGIDDDCNPATPDAIGAAVVTTTLILGSTEVTVGEVIQIFARFDLDPGPEAYDPVFAELILEDAFAATIHSEIVAIGALLPGSFLEHTFEVDSTGFAAGMALARVVPTYGADLWPEAQAGFELVSPEHDLVGELVGPRQISPGSSLDLDVTVENTGAADVTAVVEVELVSTTSGLPVDIWSSGLVNIVAGASFAATASFTTPPEDGLLTILTATIDGIEYGLDVGRVDVVWPDGVFRRGDATGDGVVNLADPLFALAYMFQGGPEPTCVDTIDVTDDGQVSLADPIYLLAYMFQGGPPPLPPGPSNCGLDPTDDTLPPCEYDNGSC